MIHRQKHKETDCRISAPFSWVSLGVPSTPSSPCPLCIPYSVMAVGMNIDLYRQFKDSKCPSPVNYTGLLGDPRTVADSGTTLPSLDAMLILKSPNHKVT